jgi:hypothetical protein
MIGQCFLPDLLPDLLPVMPGEISGMEKSELPKNLCKNSEVFETIFQPKLN